MKNKFVIYLSIIAIAVFFCCTFPVYGYTIETLDRSADAEEIRGMENDLLDSVQGFFEFEDMEAFVDYPRAVKIYIDTNIFEYKNLSENNVASILEDTVYLWEVPVKTSEGKYIICTVSRKPPISEETRRELLEAGGQTEEELGEAIANVGQWTIASASYDETQTDYIDTIDGILGEGYHAEDERQLYLLGGTPNMRLPFALFGEEDDYKILVLDSWVLDRHYASSFTGKPSDDFQSKNIFDYETVQKYISKLPPEDSMGDTGPKLRDETQGSIYVFVFCGVVTAFFALIIYIRYKSKRHGS